MLYPTFSLDNTFSRCWASHRTNPALTPDFPCTSGTLINDEFILFTLHLLKEEFLDIPVALAGCNMLEERLKESFITMETLDGSNQYHCDSCDQLVDAKRVS